MHKSAGMVREIQLVSYEKFLAELFHLQFVIAFAVKAVEHKHVAPDHWEVVETERGLVQPDFFIGHDMGRISAHEAEATQVGHQTQLQLGLNQLHFVREELFIIDDVLNLLLYESQIRSLLGQIPHDRDRALVGQENLSLDLDVLVNGDEELSKEAAV